MATVTYTTPGDVIRIIGDTRPWQRQTNNGMLSHGVSFLVTLNITEDTPLHPSSTKFEHSSVQSVLQSRRFGN